MVCKASLALIALLGSVADEVLSPGLVFLVRNAEVISRVAAFGQVSCLSSWEFHLVSVLPSVGSFSRDIPLEGFSIAASLEPAVSVFTKPGKGVSLSSEPVVDEREAWRRLGHELSGKWLAGSPDLARGT